MTLEQLKQQQDKKHAQKIADYLVNRCEEDKCLEEKILNSNKTLKGCIDYCKNEARNQAEDGCAMVEDQEVYDWAVHYFLEDSIDFEPKEIKETPKKETKKVNTLFGEQEIEEKPKKVETPKIKKEVKSEFAKQLSLFD